jgi:hypothetical protein
MKLRNMHILRLKLYLIVGFVPLFIAACGNGSNLQTIEATVDVSSPVPLLPTPTATSAPDMVLLVKSSTVNSQLPSSIVEHVYELASSTGYGVEEIEFDHLNSRVSDDVRLIIAMDATEGISDLAASHPDIGFITYDDAESTPENVYQLRSHQNRNDQSGFLAGYIAALITPNYRVGGLALSGEGRENAAIQGFLNGVIFYCGLCRPVYPPFNEYPQSMFVSGTDPSEIMTAIQSLKDLGVSTVYLSPELNTESVFNALTEIDLRLVGHVTPPAESGITWVATIAPDLEPALDAAWQAWINDEPGQLIEAPMGIRSPNNELLSIGKLDHLKTVIEDLSSGRIDPAVDPFTGEAR